MISMGSIIGSPRAYEGITLYDTNKTMQINTQNNFYSNTNPLTIIQNFFAVHIEIETYHPEKSSSIFHAISRDSLK